MSDQNNNLNVAPETTATEQTKVDLTKKTDPAPAPAAPASPVDDVLKLLQDNGIDEAAAKTMVDNLGIETVDDLKMVSESDLLAAGIKPIKARKLLATFTPAEPAPAPAAQPVAPTTIGADYTTILPVAPTNESWLKALKAGGVLKVGTESYISAIRVVFASKVGLYDLPQKIVDAMERFADETDSPVPDEFYKIRKEIVRHNYADIFSAIDGLDGSYVTDARRKDFLRRVDSTLWPAIREAYVALNGWVESVRATNGDINNVIAAIGSIMAGGAAAGVGVTMPPYDAVMDASETLKDAINHIFRGVGGPVAAAMAYDAEQTANYLDNPILPQLLGVANREQMLKKFGANISPNYARQEAYVVRFVLSYVKFSDNIAAGDEARYLNALWQLGSQINWDTLGLQGGVTSIGGNKML